MWLYACVSIYTRWSFLMKMFCFDYPCEAFPSDYQSGLKEGYGRLSGQLHAGIFKFLGILDMSVPSFTTQAHSAVLFAERHAYGACNPLSSRNPLHKPNSCKHVNFMVASYVDFVLRYVAMKKNRTQIIALDILVHVQQIFISVHETTGTSNGLNFRHIIYTLN